MSATSSATSSATAKSPQNNRICKLPGEAWINYSSTLNSKNLPSLKLTARTWTWMVGRVLSFWEGLLETTIFRGELLVSGRVNTHQLVWWPSLKIMEPMGDTESALYHELLQFVVLASHPLEMLELEIPKLHGNPGVSPQMPRLPPRNKALSIKNWMGPNPNGPLRKLRSSY